MNSLKKKHTAFGGRLLIVGFGSIGQGVLPLILRHVDMPLGKITVLSADDDGRRAKAEKYGVKFIHKTLTSDNYREVLEPLLSEGDFLLNLSVDVSTHALVTLCREHGALYLDTCIEPWPGGYDNPELTPSQRSNYLLREEVLPLRDTTGKYPTALVAHGANPGLVSLFIKEALLNIARDTGMNIEAPTNRDGWSHLAKDLGIKVIQIAERDTQASATPKRPDEFVNTWSIFGFYGEGIQPSEMGWGSHEEVMPFEGARHDFGCQAAIYLDQPGCDTQSRSWTPLAGPFLGYVITHNEAISIADYYTVKSNGKNNGRGTAKKPAYRPTVYYAYHPCDAAVISLREIAAGSGKLHPKHRLLMEEILPGGIDELGVLLMGHKKGAYWYGSRLMIDEARKLAPHNNATSLQVTSSVLAGMVWAMENPRRGLVETDEIEHERMLEIARPYLGEVLGVYSDWTPLLGRKPEDNPLFPEDLNFADPWQFKNFRFS